jgi:hypothetical protein
MDLPSHSSAVGADSPRRWSSSSPEPLARMHGLQVRARGRGSRGSVIPPSPRESELQLREDVRALAIDAREAKTRMCTATPRFWCESKLEVLHHSAVFRAGNALHITAARVCHLGRCVRWTRPRRDPAASLPSLQQGPRRGSQQREAWPRKLEFARVQRGQMVSWAGPCVLVAASMHPCSSLIYELRAVHGCHDADEPKPTDLSSFKGLFQRDRE